LTSGDAGRRDLARVGSTQRLPSRRPGPDNTGPAKSGRRGRAGGRHRRRQLDPGRLPRRRPHLHCGDDSRLISPAEYVGGGDCLCSGVSAGSAIDRICGLRRRGSGTLLVLRSTPRTARFASHTTYSRSRTARRRARPRLVTPCGPKRRARRPANDAGESVGRRQIVISLETTTRQ
jgi:hypothetical protein